VRAIVRKPSAALARCELTYLARQPIDLTRADAQHEAYLAALRAQGVDVLILPPEPDLPDAVFVEDTAIVVDECAVITRPGADSRRPETDTVAVALAPFRPLVRMTSPATLDGGDVLRVGRTFLVGRTARTNEEGIRQLDAALAPHGYAVEPVTPDGCLHLKSAATSIGRETVLVNPDWIDPGVFGRWQCVPVPAEEPHGANALLVGEVVHVAASAPLTRRKLDALGFTTAALDTSEFEKAEAALTCLSLIFA
jgi:dimethylargininase